jgi:pyruvate/2-oxoglutarate dehydrogenase complex dihydrolipoamide dehydrogenase (E3) component
MTGGQINVASRGKHKEDLNLVASFLSGQINKLGVEVRLDTAMTASLIRKINPDVLIIATGSDPAIPAVPGTKQENVFDARQVLLGRKKVGKRVVIIGGGRVGLELAEYLKNDNNEITIVEMLDKMGRDLGDSFRFATLNRLRDIGIKFMVNTRLEKINGSHVTVSNSGDLQELDADSIVLAIGAVSNKDVCAVVDGKIKTYCIGDCKKPRNILEAIAEGAKLGRQL